MKENMEAIYEKAADVAQSAKRTAVLLATISQKKLLIAREQEKIRRNYTRIGKVYYKDYVTDEEPDEAEYKPLCEEISNSFRYINDLRDEIEDAKEEYRAAKQPVKPGTGPCGRDTRGRNAYSRITLKNSPAGAEMSLHPP